MKKEIMDQLLKDKLLEYLKQNTHYIKKLKRDPSFYKEFKKIIKEKYKLRTSDKISEIMNDIEVISNIISTIN